ncbi:TPA: hypothetical protein HA335_05375 [Methanocaldococcus jannaschii]|uniref:Uncharacterized protein n=1 Tax=Methanocaldococcus jannaschii TaxID=2190 RepID=A0A832T2A8_9EURY|nr:hypothetical protein [Methanocaldococcus jannaschii]
MTKKRELLFNAIFDIYKIFLGAGLTLLVAVVIKVSFSEGSFNIGLSLILTDITIIIYISLLFGAILYDIYKRL